MKGALLLFSIVFLTSCVDPYEFSIEGNPEVLIVDAVLTDEQKEHKITLSISRGLTNDHELDTIRYVSGATVYVEDNDLNRTYYHEQTQGIYKTDLTFSGQVGSSYVLHIETPDGKIYQSNSEILLSGVPMDSIYARYDERLSTEVTAILKGIQFFVDTRNIDTPNLNFRYEFIESYEIISPLVSQYVMEYSTEEIISRVDPINVCYKTIRSNVIQTATTNGLDQPVIAELPIRFATSKEAQLRNDYMLTVKQYTISSNAYQFYKNLKENNESAGSFFDKQKGTVLGNISEVGNGETLVLGYFEVGGLSIKRRRYSNPDFARLGLRINVNNDLCESPLAVGLDTLFRSVPPNVYNILTYIPPLIFGDPPTGVYVNPSSCSDCRSLGSLVKPQHWD